ncbi:hypothetical protein Ancab_034316 [Ancistrocladus abbreviatus]
MSSPSLCVVSTASSPTVMAAEASRSSASPDSYIGSLISLTSKSEIRYEGILFNINTEEASIGLRDVQSFGTEGRRKDGLQIPPIDKVFEYIVFRGSDIKDLQVKSSPPVQTTTAPVYSDPAIIRSHYQQPSATSSSFSSATNGPISGLSTSMSQPDLSRSTVQGGLSFYQPGGSLGSTGSSTPSPSNGSGLAVPRYWQGFYGPSSSHQNQQQNLLQPPQGFSMPPAGQRSAPYPMNASLSAGTSDLLATSSEFPPPLIPPIGSSSLNMQSSMFPVQAAPVPSDAFPNTMPNKASVQLLSTMSQSSSLPLASPLAPVLDKTASSSLVPNQAKHPSGSVIPYNSISEPLRADNGTSAPPSLVTPGQFLQPGPSILSFSLSSQMTQKEVEVVQVASSVLQPLPPLAAVSAVTVPGSASTEAQAPLLPMSSPSNQKLSGAPSHTHYLNRGGHERGRGNKFSHPVTNFTEEFDFEAMNEKFKKDEVWGHLGKSKAKCDDDRELQYENEDDVDLRKVEIKPVYKKDDFFDTLSCNFLDNGSRNGRTRFSEQMRIDAETFGDFSRYQGGRGGRGSCHGGRRRGGYYGWGYGYVGRGQGHSLYRAS